MIAVALVVAIALAGDPLGPAREAFARAEYDQAESLALAAAQPPQEGAALYLAGLARFRAGQAASALEALDRAAQASDPPAPALWRYNRGACFYELGRFAEAERDYLDAAALDETLAVAALVNAGFAALDAGARERAKALAARARAAATAGPALELVKDLEAHLTTESTEAAPAAEAYRSGLAAYDAGRFAEAREQFQRAAELDRADGRSLVMSGASAYRLGERAQARDDLERSLTLRLDPGDAQAARDYLGALSRGLSAHGEGFEGSGRLGAGVDSDPLQTSLSGPGDFNQGGSSATASAVATAALAVALRGRISDRLFGEVAYGFDQLAYTASAAADRSLQQHGIAASVELPLRDLRLGATLGGQLAFTGLSSFRGLEAAAGLGAWAALDESEPLTTRLDLSATHKVGLAEFGYLGGNRLEADLSQELRLPAVTLDLGYQLRLEALGTQLQNAPPPPRGGCPLDCRAQFAVPYGYLGNTVWLSARTGLWSRLDLELSGGFELRDYLDDSYLLLSRGDGTHSEVASRRRQDKRGFGSAQASIRLTRALSLSLRYDLIVNRSNLGGEPPDPNNHDYDKHLFTLGTTVVW